MLNKKRFRNYGLWTAIVAQILLIVQLGASLFFGYTVTEELKTEIVLFADAVLVFLSILGIINNPTNPEGKGFNL